GLRAFRYSPALPSPSPRRRALSSTTWFGAADRCSPAPPWLGDRFWGQISGSPGSLRGLEAHRGGSAESLHLQGTRRVEATCTGVPPRHEVSIQRKGSKVRVRQKALKDLQIAISCCLC